MERNGVVGERFNRADDDGDGDGRQLAADGAPLPPPRATLLPPQAPDNPRNSTYSDRGSNKRLSILTD